MIKKDTRDSKKNIIINKDQTNKYLKQAYGTRLRRASLFYLVDLEASTVWNAVKSKANEAYNSQ